jgi:hypothetical protein
MHGRMISLLAQTSTIEAAKAHINTQFSILIIEALSAFFSMDGLR